MKLTDYILIDQTQRQYNNDKFTQNTRKLTSYLPKTKS